MKTVTVLLLWGLCACNSSDLTDTQLDAAPRAPDAALDAPISFDAPLPDAGPFIPENNCRITLTGDTTSGVVMRTVEILEPVITQNDTHLEIVQAVVSGASTTTQAGCTVVNSTPVDDAGFTTTLDAIGLSTRIPGKVDEFTLPFTVTDPGQVSMTYQPNADTRWSTSAPGGSITFTVTSVRKSEFVSPRGNYDNEIKGTAHGVLTPATPGAQGTLTMDIVFF